MSVIRRKGFGAKIEVTGPNPAVAVLALAEVLERPLHRNGGARERHPTGLLRDAYVSVGVTRFDRARIKKNAADSGLCVSSYLGMLIERALQLSDDDLEEWLSFENSSSALTALERSDVEKTRGSQS